MILSERLENALILAAKAHIKQFRKGSDIPYITHPVHLALILTKRGYDEDVIISAILHDVIEDTNTTLDEIETRFGPKVKEVIYYLTEQKRDASGPVSWEERKRKSLDLLAVGGVNVNVVKAVDTLHNATTLLIDLKTFGPGVWDRFDRGSSKILSYYRSVCAVIRKNGVDAQLIEELEAVIEELDKFSNI